MKETKLTAVFGGTFDPVHFGHFGLAEYILAHGHADRIVFLPWRTRPIFVEMKSEVGRLSDAQRMWAGWLRNYGQSVRTVYGLAGLEEFFREIGMDEAAQRARARREKEEKRKK